jgi:Zinc carboxypeptidase
MLYIHSSCQALCTAVLAICLLAVNCLAEDPLEVLPKVSRLDSIKTPQQFYGFAIGSRHLRHDQVVDYLQYLEGVSDRVHLLQYGRTHGQRPLLVCVISHPTNVAKLDQLQKQRRKLTTGKFKGSVGDQLLVMSMGYCVHGDEASAVNCAPLVAYHLASAQDEQTLKFLQQSIALIDPALNPDGVDRFANWANENRGYYASPNPIDREHQQPWPGGRTNYYMFDLNRDWLPAVHPESSGRIKLFHAWKPNVVLDFHEMGGNSSFFFQPGEPKRINPYSPQENRRLTKLFAAEHARVMDDANELFYSEENFDDFYIGKGSTYPDLQGAVGILFEQASTRGLKFANQRVSRHFRDTIANQLRMSLSSLRSATEQHDQLLQLQVDFFKTALQTAEQHAVKAYLLTGSPSRLAAAAQLLKLHSVQVYRP